MSRKKIFAFSLVELMAVLAMIGILVSLALPRFRVFIARGRQAEAIHNLGIINKLQKSYNLKAQGRGWGDDVYHLGMAMGLGELPQGKCDNSPQAQTNTLGFRVEDCSRLRYTYYSVRVGDDIAANKAFGSRLIYPGCSGSFDTWDMEKTGKLKHRIDAIEKCTD